VTTLSPSKLVLVDPTAEPLPEVAAMARRPGTLHGLTVGLLANNKPNSMRLLEAVAAELSVSHGLGRARPWSKPTAYRVALPGVLDEMVTGAEVAISAIGD
jgi:hypothetical protein